MTRELDDVSDTDLLDRSREGDTLAYGVLWKRHWQAARAMAASVTSRFDPDDLASEAFARILKAVEKGKGPRSGFRSYLATTIRNVAIDWSRRKTTPNIEDPDGIEDWTYSELTALGRIDQETVARAFYALPDSWQEVLWYTEVEDMAPRDVAPLLGLTPNAVSALAVRAREGLRQAWINAHLAEAGTDNPAHSWTLKKLGSFVRGKLSRVEHRKVMHHLENCEPCSAAAEEADRVGSRLALGILPLILGVAGAASYTAWGNGAGTAVAATLPGAGVAVRRAGNLRHLFTSATTGSNIGMGAVAATVVAAAALTAGAVIGAPQANEPAASAANAAAVPPGTDDAPRQPATGELSAPAGPEDGPSVEPQDGRAPAADSPRAPSTPPPSDVWPDTGAGRPAGDTPPSTTTPAGMTETPPEPSPSATPTPAPTSTPGPTPSPTPSPRTMAEAREAAVRTVPPADTLLAYRVDDAPGSTTATDFIHGNSAAYAGSPGTPGWSLTDSVLRAPTDAFSIQIWFRTTTGGGRLLGFGSAAQGTSFYFDRHLFLADDGRLVFGVFPGAVHTIASTESYSDGNWHQATATLSVAGMALYVDGERVAQDPSVTQAQDFSGYWRVGYDNLAAWGPDTPTRRQFAGDLGFAAVYSDALTADQVRLQWNESN
ncbi:sigma-70 family RNA polymerase sigma factor [Leifsonia sp. fls2-241-R2A-40a]|uniref:sigma-70 family RNA polymerase sigma factor n=1 Tax=Leifsonia sp. fls2-241-R2A-40a TaxID=3040290 RepID=UPI00254BC6E5|nr:sigma-70 family RNA polymerase sigma factor [Leifsonia sp. fls2-241-R2A-40a]